MHALPDASVSDVRALVNAVEDLLSLRNPQLENVVWTRLHNVRFLGALFRLWVVNQCGHVRVPVAFVCMALQRHGCCAAFGVYRLVNALHQAVAPGLIEGALQPDFYRQTVGQALMRMFAYDRKNADAVHMLRAAGAVLRWMSVAEVRALHDSLPRLFSDSLAVFWGADAADMLLQRAAIDLARILGVAGRPDCKDAIWQCNRATFAFVVRFHAP